MKSDVSMLLGNNTEGYPGLSFTTVCQKPQMRLKLKPAAMNRADTQSRYLHLFLESRNVVNLCFSNWVGIHGGS